MNIGFDAATGHTFVWHKLVIVAEFNENNQLIWLNPSYMGNYREAI